MVAPVLSGHLVGYARVSTDDQDLSLQIDSLAGLGINQANIFTEKISGTKTDRPHWMLALPSYNKAIRLWSGGWIDSVAPCTTWSSSLKICVIAVSAFGLSVTASSTRRARRVN